MGDETIRQKQEVVQGARALGSLGRKYTGGLIGRLQEPLAHLTTAGKAVAAAAAALVLLSIGLILFDASHFSVSPDRTAEILVQKVNVRQAPTTGSGVLAQAVNGDRFLVLGSQEDWTNVRSADGRVTGWIASSLLSVDQRRSFIYRYEMKGYVLLLIFSAAALFGALRLGRRRA